MEREKRQTQTILTHLFDYCVLSTYPEPRIRMNSWKYEPATTGAFPQLLESTRFREDGQDKKKKRKKHINNCGIAWDGLSSWVPESCENLTCGI